ncbi:ABC transporter permease [bacterium]|nr:ABC transporter permease [bacterium]
MSRSRQLLALLRLTIRRGMRGRFFWGTLILAGLPVMIILARTIVLLVLSRLSFADPLPLIGGESAHSSETIDSMQYMLVVGYMHFSVIFAAIMFGKSALREEFNEQTLHYLFLQPIPRWLILAGKYLGFLIIAWPIFMLALTTAQILAVLPFGLDGMYSVLIERGRLLALVREFFVIGLSLAVFSALFLALSTVFKNVFDALFIYGWETASSLLPTVLKNFSLTFYFTHLLPQQAARRTATFEILAEPPGAIQTTIVLATVLIASLAFSFWMMTRKQCIYSTD